MFRLALAAALCLLVQPALAGDTPAPLDAKVFFVNVKNGDKIYSPFVVKLGISGMSLAPAGTRKPNTGHFHIFIDVPAAAGMDFMRPVHRDKHHIDLSNGGNEATLRLSPGKHTLQLVLGDWQHIPHELPIMSKRITVTVITLK